MGCFNPYRQTRKWEVSVTHINTDCWRRLRKGQSIRQKKAKEATAFQQPVEIFCLFVFKKKDSRFLPYQYSMGPSLQFLPPPAAFPTLGNRPLDSPFSSSGNKLSAAVLPQHMHISQPQPVLASVPTTASVQQKHPWFNNLDKDLRPVLILFVSCHKKVAGQDRHEAIPFGFEIDGGISSE